MTLYAVMRLINVTKITNFLLTKTVKSPIIEAHQNLNFFFTFGVAVLLEIIFVIIIIGVEKTILNPGRNNLSF